MVPENRETCGGFIWDVYWVLWLIKFGLNGGVEVLFLCELLLELQMVG